MAISLAAQFARHFVGTALTSMTEISDYITSQTGTVGSSDVDQTTFAVGGGLVTENIIQGALTGQVTLNLLYAAITADYSAIYAGKRDGFIYMGYNGANAAPTAGDEVFMMSAVLLNAALTYTPGSTATINWSLSPVDSATYAPDFYVL